VEPRRGFGSSRQDEALELGEGLVVPVAELLELVDLRLRDSEAGGLRRERNRKIRAEVEEGVLDPRERGAQFGVELVEGQHEADVRVELVDGTVRDDARVELGDARAVSQARLAPGAAPRVDLRQADGLVPAAGAHSSARLPSVTASSVTVSARSRD